jgi:hypothetical protein
MVLMGGLPARLLSFPALAIHVVLSFCFPAPASSGKD